MGQRTDSLNSLYDTLKVDLLWISGRRNIEAKKRANGLARQGSAIDNPLMGTGCVPLATVKGGIYSPYLKDTDFKWRRLAAYAKSRKNWHCYKKNRSRVLLGYTRKTRITNSFVDRSTLVFPTAILILIVSDIMQRPLLPSLIGDQLD